MELKNRGLDSTTAATAGTLTLGKAKLELPNRIPTGSEASAARNVQQKDAFSGQELAVSAKLMGPDKLKELLGTEGKLQAFAKNVQGDQRLAGARASMLFLVMRGEAAIEDSQQLRTLLDLQWLTEQDAILVQHGAVSPTEDLIADYAEAKRWLKERGGDKPLLPVVTPYERPQEAERAIKMLVDRGAPGIMLDLQGQFPYYTLRAIENVKRKNPTLWVHAFQAPPKARWAGKRLHMGWGMTLPLFGIDSFSRWVVPPPPVPVTRERINFWEPANWGVMKLKEYQDTYGEKLSCKCALCKGSEGVDKFLEGDPRVLLSKAKTHDHYAQRAELEKVQDKVREGKFGEYLAKKRFAKEFATAMKEIPQTE
ncbi:MAG: hypothetical protein LC624_08660 [Halobacteriales archaeon]|nr:hypothetical protein [Halobacteriales archaeon]